MILYQVWHGLSLGKEMCLKVTVPSRTGAFDIAKVGNGYPKKRGTGERKRKGGNIKFETLTCDLGDSLGPIHFVWLSASVKIIVKIATCLLRKEEAAQFVAIWMRQELVLDKEVYCSESHSLRSRRCSHLPLRCNAKKSGSQAAGNLDQSWHGRVDTGCLTLTLGHCFFASPEDVKETRSSAQVPFDHSGVGGGVRKPA